VEVVVSVALWVVVSVAASASVRAEASSPVQAVWSSWPGSAQVVVSGSGPGPGSEVASVPAAGSWW
jgi:hypothetical protein